MEQFQSVAKKWGNSIGFAIPSEIVKKMNITPQKVIKLLIIDNEQKDINEIFATATQKKNTQQIMNEIDEGYDEH